MRKIQRTIAVLAFALCGFGTEAEAAGTLININVGLSATTGVNYAVDGGTSSGTWNAASNIKNGKSNLVTSTGAVTTAAISFASATTNAGSISTGQDSFSGLPGDAMMKNYMYSPLGVSSTMTLTGLTNGTYDIYIYTHGNNTITNTLTVNYASGAYTTSASTTGNGNLLTNYVLGKDYLLLRNVTVTGGTFVLTYSGSATVAGTINGLQIQAVPEPSVVMMLGIGGILFVGYSRMRSSIEESPVA
jgi:hypothetical protein